MDVGRWSGLVSLVRGVVRDGRKIVSFLDVVEHCRVNVAASSPAPEGGISGTHSANMHSVGPISPSPAEL